MGYFLLPKRSERTQYQNKAATALPAKFLQLFLLSSLPVFLQKDIEAVKKSCKDKPLKVILETDLLTNEEIAKACELCIKAKADFVKTSTGFVKNGIGAQAEHVKLMASIVKPHGLGVKASAGIRDKQKALEMIEAGADRLGTSSGVAIVG